MLVSAVSRNKWAIFVLGDLGHPHPGPLCERPPAASARPPGAAALLLYLDTPLFCDCSTQQGPRGPPPAPGGAGGQRGGERRCGGHRGLREAGRQDLSLASLPAKPSPGLAHLRPPSFAERGNSTTGNKTAHARWKRKNRCMFTFL